MSNNTSRSLNGLKILVVDDSKTIRRTAETLLTKEGCQVFTAIDGFDALWPHINEKAEERSMTSS